MIPLAVTVFCFSCRMRTAHKHVRMSLYSCLNKCGSPWKEVGNPQEKTEEAIKAAKMQAAENRAAWRKEREIDALYWNKGDKNVKRRS